MMDREAIWDRGFAVPVYDIVHGTVTWDYRGESIVLPIGAVDLHDIGVGRKVAKWAEVKREAESQFIYAPRPVLKPQ